MKHLIDSILLLFALFILINLAFLHLNQWWVTGIEAVVSVGFILQTVLGLRVTNLWGIEKVEEENEENLLN